MAAYGIDRDRDGDPLFPALRIVRGSTVIVRQAANSEPVEDVDSLAAVQARLQELEARVKRLESIPDPGAGVAMEPQTRSPR